MSYKYSATQLIHPPLAWFFSRVYSIMSEENAAAIISVSEINPLYNEADPAFVQIKLDCLLKGIASQKQKILFVSFKTT